MKLNKDKIIKLQKEFYGVEDAQDIVPECIGSDFGDMIINPKYSRKRIKNIKNQNSEAELQRYEELSIDDE